jgi:restriction system protein
MLMANSLQESQKAFAMALWLVRGGSHGEHEPKFLNESRIYLTWEGLNYNLK